MRTLPVAEPNVKAFRAILYDRTGVLGKVQGRIYFFDDDGTIVGYEPEHAVFTTVLGRTDLADTQRFLDVVVHGGYAQVACDRQMEVR